MKKDVKKLILCILTEGIVAATPFIVKELKEFSKDGGKYDL